MAPSYLRALSAHGYDEHAQVENRYRTFYIAKKTKLILTCFSFYCFKPVYFYKGVIMEFTDIAMELSKEAWQASFQHPFVLQLQEGTLEPSIFRYYLIQDAYYLRPLRSLSPLG